MCQWVHIIFLWPLQLYNVTVAYEDGSGASIQSIASSLSGMFAHIKEMLQVNCVLKINYELYVLYISSGGWYFS